MKYELSGKFHLRRRSDLAGLVLASASGEPGASPIMMANYVCMAMCPTACQRPSCGHCATALYLDKPGADRCTRPTRLDSTEQTTYKDASGACSEGLTDCRSCA